VHVRGAEMVVELMEGSLHSLRIVARVGIHVRHSELAKPVERARELFMPLGVRKSEQALNSTEQVKVGRAGRR
jgi:hypothetical protein